MSLLKNFRNGIDLRPEMFQHISINVHNKKSKKEHTTNFKVNCPELLVFFAEQAFVGGDAGPSDWAVLRTKIIF